MLDLHDVYLPGLQNGGHLDQISILENPESEIRNPVSVFFCWNLFVLDIAYILFISIASPRYISCRIVFFFYSRGLNNS